MKKVLFILGELNDEDIDWILYVGQREELVAGSILIQEGEPTDALYIVLNGSLSVCLDVLGGQEIARLGVGEVVGEMSFIETRLPSATVEAAERTLVLAIPRQQLSRKLYENLEFASRFYRAIALFLSERLRVTVSHLGYGDETSHNEPTYDPDAINPIVMENLALAKVRFDSLLKRLRGY